MYDIPGVYRWIPDSDVYAIDVTVKAGGGGGASGMSHSTTTARLCGPGGGGGGVTINSRRYGMSGLRDGIDVVVGGGGTPGAAPAAVNGAWNPGNDGGFSAFGDLLRAEGGHGGGRTVGGADPDIGRGGDGGHAVMRGGRGGSYTLAPESTSSEVIRLLAGGGGGGRGAGYNASGGAVAASAGGTSGPVGMGNWRTLLAATHTSGDGGAGAPSASTAAGVGASPSGGGGGGAGGNPASAGSRGGDGEVIVIEYVREAE